MLQDPNGLPFTLGFVDGVMRPESLGAAATGLSRVAPLVPGFLPWYLRAAVRAGGLLAPGLPAPTVPIARTVLREMVGHLVADARPAKLGPAIAKLREGGARLNLNLLGEAVLGEEEAQRRLDGIHDLIRRDDVDYVSVKVSAVVSRISMWAFDEVVEKVAERLLPLYLTAAQDPWSSTSAKKSVTFVNLDMEEYRDLDLTIAVFTRILEDPRLQQLEAGIVLQAYLPDALPALRELTAWARDRVDRGGAPIKVRLVKGANLAMERVEATMHGWTPAPYDVKVDTDANYLRCLSAAMTPESLRAVRIGVAGHNLFDIAYAWLLARDRGVVPALRQAQGPGGDVERGRAQRDRDETPEAGDDVSSRFARSTTAGDQGSAPIEFEMLLGMAQGQVEAVSREVGHVLLYVPVVRPHEFDVAISYLVRRLEENASSENFLSAAFRLHDDPDLLDREVGRFAVSLERSTDPGLPTGPRRRQDRLAPVHESVARTADPDAADGALTQAVLGIAGVMDRNDTFVETAVFASREDESAVAAGAPGFRNTPDSDPALPANREWARQILARIPGSTAGDGILRSAGIEDPALLDQAVDRVRDAAANWGSRPAAERAEMLLRAAAVLDSRRAELIEVAAAETGKVVAEGDVEVSETVDFAKYYAAKARELDAVPGAAFVPARVTVVAPPWNFPLAIPAGGVLAALAAGSGVVFKPAPQARRSAAVIAAALWDAGIPRDLLALVDIAEGELGRQLIAHPHVDRVILTGSWDTAALFRSWRHDLPLQAETSGKNALVIAPSADLDLAVADLVKSAFGHAGQKCSAASLAILVGPVGRSKRFARQLVDATRSMRVGWPEDPLAEIGPVIEPPRGKLRWALTELDPDEKWLLKPRLIDEFVGAAVDAGHPRRGAGRIPVPPRGVLRTRARHHARADPRPGRRAAERRGLRSHRGAAHAGSGRPRALAGPGAGGQSLCQSRDHRRDRAASAVRRLEALLRRHRHEGRRAEPPDRPRILARHRRRRIDDAASARAGHPHHRAHRGVPALTRLHGVRMAAPGGAVGRPRLGPRVRSGARRLPAGRGAQPVPVPVGAGRRARDRRGAAARAAASHDCGDPGRRRVHPVGVHRTAGRCAPGARRGRDPRVRGERRRVDPEVHAVGRSRSGVVE